MELLDAAQSYERKFNLALMYSGLRLPQYKVIDFLEKSGKITVSDLSRQLHVTRATISVLITKLVKAGIVECSANRSDKRSFYIIITERGLNRLKAARNEISLVEEKISQQLSEETILCLNNFSRVIRK